MGRSISSISTSLFGGKRFFTVSGTFIVPATGKYRIQCIGGGGSGGISRSGTVGSFPSEYARGGGGGGFALKEVFLVAGDSYTVTVGAGGAVRSDPGAGVRANGNPGGTSSFGSIVSATGGLGGIASIATGNATFLGGTGVGGDINFTGGDGGRFITNITGASGGGAAGTIYGNGGSGGDFNTGTGTKSASGGGSVSWNAPTLTGFLSNYDWGAGAGTGLQSTLAANRQNPGAQRYDINSAITYPATSSETHLVARSLQSPISPLDGKGAASGSNQAGPGAGGSGQIASAAVSTWYIDGGICGGGGGVVVDFEVAGYNGGSSKLGGGGGGLLYIANTSGGASGPGGPGIVIVEW